MLTVGLSGLAITIGLLTLLQLGTTHFGSQAIGTSIAFTSFALCLIVAAVECRSETASVSTQTFDDPHEPGDLVELVAVLVTQMDIFHRPPRHHVDRRPAVRLGARPGDRAPAPLGAREAPCPVVASGHRAGLR